MPSPTKAVRLVRQSRRDPYTSIGGDYFKDDVEDGICDRITVEIPDFDASDEEDSEDQQPQIVCELAADLFAYELGAYFFGFGGLDGGGDEGGGDVVDGKGESASEFRC